MYACVDNTVGYGWGDTSGYLSIGKRLREILLDELIKGRGDAWDRTKGDKKGGRKMGRKLKVLPKGVCPGLFVIQASALGCKGDNLN